MKKIILVLILSIVTFLSSNIASNARGLLYTNTNYPVTATGVQSPDDLDSLKEGESSSLNILGLVETGDASINKAAKDANIKNINFIDVNVKSIFLFYTRITTHVYGE
jgi:hypothetical protein